MGWVEDRFASQTALNQGVPKLWNAIRDCFGKAVLEYNSHVVGTGQELTQSDCTSNGRWCKRLEKRTGSSSLEVYLDISVSSLKMFRQPENIMKVICIYRLAKDGSLELFFRALEGDVVRTPEEACRMAMEEFLFDPFPLPYSISPQL
ncbi:MAG TPA: hypothetical protein VMB25_07335 [Bryobacteraceae bacterium]|nr:hypothetical protein [Bryobacteraceae bacterium]